MGGAAGEHRRPRQGCGHLAAATGTCSAPTWSWSSPPSLQGHLSGCARALLGLGGGNPCPGGHSLVGQAYMLPDTPLLRGAKEATLNLGLKNEQEFVGQGEGEGKHAGENVGGRRPRVARPGWDGCGDMGGQLCQVHASTGTMKLAFQRGPAGM